jgi:hypothetical protein
MKYQESKTEFEEYMRKLAIARIQTMPPNSKLHIGKFGSFTQKELIEEVEANTELGKATVETERDYILLLPKISARMG